jgi:YesN/AraC family two-component response regulator
LRELQVLGNLYDKQIQHQLELDESEQQQLLEVTGERGTACAARLGLPADATLAQMREQIEAKLKYWRSCSADPGNNPIRRQTATIISQSFDRLAYHIDEVEKHLNLSEEDIDQVVLSKVLANCLNISELAHLSDQWQEISRGYVDRKSVEEYNKWLQQLKSICFMGRQKYKDAQLDSIQKLAACIEKIEANNLPLKELQLWQSYQENKFILNPEEVKELHNIIGKNGTTLFMRLGLEPTTQLSVMLIQIEKCKNYWIGLANDPFGCDPQTRWAANIFIFIYDRLHYHLEEARYHLELN